MAKARGAEPPFFSGIIEGIKKNTLEIIEKMVREKVALIKKIGLEISLALFFLMAGLFFTLTSFVFFLHDAYSLSLSESFLLVGVGSLILTLLLYILITKK